MSSHVASPLCHAFNKCLFLLFSEGSNAADSAVEDSVNDENSVPRPSNKRILAKNLGNKINDNNTENNSRILRDNSNIVVPTKPNSSRVRQALQFETSAEDEVEQSVSDKKVVSPSLRDASYDGDCSGSTQLSGTLSTINDMNCLNSQVSDSDVSDGWILMDDSNPTKCNDVEARVDVTGTNQHEDVVRFGHTVVLSM